jgi:hypothetical protein
MSHLLSPQTVLEPIHKLKPHPRNPRQGDVDAITASVNSNGFFGGIVAQRSTGHILVGNHRWQAAAATGITHLPVFWLDVDDERALRILLADNRTNDLAGYDQEALAGILNELSQLPAAFEGTGYGSDDLDDILAGIAYDNDTWDIYKEKDTSEIDQLRHELGIETGQVWLIPSATRAGRVHRLYVGDARDSEILMAGETANGVCSDPPYELGAEAVADIIGRYADTALIMGGDKQVIEMCGIWHFRQMLVWYHREPRMLPNPGMPMVHHALCPILTRTKDVRVGYSKPADQPGFKSVVEVEGKEFVSGGFGHTKSHKVFVQLMAGLPEWKLVVDPFAGTGTTIIAAETLGKTCYAAELDPAHAAAAIDRLRQAGLEPVKQ